jgi:Zn ribbon nucleic-acid-binding protein
MVNAGCKYKCVRNGERRTHVDFVKTFAEDEIQWKRCNECGYSKQTTETKCYCCKNMYRTRPHGASRKMTRHVIMARIGTRRIE